MAWSLGEDRWGKPRRRSGRTAMEAALAALVLVAAGVSQRVPNPWRAPVRHALLTALDQSSGWAAPNSEVVRDLVNFVEQRSWGAAVALWIPRAEPPSAWMWPVLGAHLTRAYGWADYDGHVQWSPGLTLATSADAPVLAPAVAAVGPTGARQVTLIPRGQTGWRVVLAPVSLAPGIRPGRTVVAGALLGHVHGTTLRVLVERDGYPTNPLARGRLVLPRVR